MSDELLRKHESHITRLTLHRPQKANALSAALVEALLDAVEYAATDGTRLLIIEGVLSIQSGDNPRILAQKLWSFLPPAARDNPGDEDSGSGAASAAA